MVHYPVFAFSVHIFQSTVDLLHLRCQCREFATYIGSDLFLAVDAFVLLNVLGHLFGNHVMMAEQTAEEGGEFVAMLHSSCFHKLVLFGEKHWITKWGFEKCLIWFVVLCYRNMSLIRLFL